MADTMVEPRTLDYIDALYAAALGDVSWIDVLRLGARVFDAQTGYLGIIDKLVPSRSTIHITGVDERALPSFFERNLKEDFWLSAARSRSHPLFHTGIGTDAVDLPTMHRKPFYNEVMIDLDVEYLVSGKALDTDRYEAYASFLRPRESSNFEPIDEVSLAPLLKHVNRSLTLSHALESTSSASWHARMVSAKFPMFALDMDGYVLEHNVSAERLLSAQSTLRVIGGRIKADHQEDQRKMERLIGTNRRTYEVQSAPEVELTAWPGTWLAAIRLPSSVLGEGLFARAATLLIVRQASYPETRLLAKSRDLTRAERRVLDAAIRGYAPAEIARQLHVQVSTVRSHLNQLYRKCGVAGRAELVHEAWAVASTRDEWARFSWLERGGYPKQ